MVAHQRSIVNHNNPLVHSSPIGLIPKPHQPGKWRLIMDLYSPPGSSVNDSASVLNATDMIRHAQLGPGTLMANVDLHQAYRIRMQTITQFWAYSGVRLLTSTQLYHLD